ncbi:MAG: FHA domain-containing protein [Kofleriaceae bacterium]
MPATLALTARAPLTCVVGVHCTLSVRELDDQLRALAAKQTITGDHVALEFDDPLDAVLGWRHLARTIGDSATLMAAFAAPAAVEMLRDPSELARDAWARLTGGEPVEHGLFVVRMLARLYHPNLEVTPLPEGVGLVIGVLGDRHPRVMTITQPAWIGRATNAPVRIEGDHISRRQVELGVDSHDGWFARDAGSPGGFYIGGHHAGARRHALHAGMVLELGPATGIVILAVHS